MSRFPQLPGFLLKSDIFMRVRVRVISNEVIAGSLVLPLGYCSARVVLTCTAMVCVKLDTLKRSPEAHFVEKVECLNRSKRCLLYYNLPVLPLNIEKFQKGLHVRRVYHPPDSHYQREDMHHPPLLSVIAQAFHQRLIRLLLSYGCRLKLCLMYVGGARQINNSYPFGLF